MSPRKSKKPVFINEDYEYAYDKNVKTPFQNKSPIKKFDFNDEWPKKMKDYIDYEDSASIGCDGRLFKQYYFDIPHIIKKELGLFEKEEDSRVKHLMDYVVTIKDKEVEIGRSENQVNTNPASDNREEGSADEKGRSNVTHVQDASQLGASGVDTRPTELSDYIPVFIEKDPSTNVLYFLDSNEGQGCEITSLSTTAIRKQISDPVITSTGHLDEDQSSINDNAFCEYRLSGPNPTSIKLCNVDYLKQLGIGGNREMLKLLKDNRLFVVDYSSFAVLPAGKSTKLVDSPIKFTYGSIAIFKSTVDSNNSSEKCKDAAGLRRQVGNSHLQPVCIQIISHDKKKKVFYPSPTNSKDVKWKTAKCIFQSNDGLHHEAFAHLASTHLVMESVLVATYRCLPEKHPLFVLLVKHVEGTNYINRKCVNDVVSDDGIFSILFTPNIASVRDLMLEHFEKFTSENMTFPARIQAREMDKCESLNYPYRDDGMLMWNAILKWVNAYLLLFYTDHGKVLKDENVLNWWHELSSSDGGRIKWIESIQLTTQNARVKLSEVVASIIFIASVEHAAVNNPQRSIMQFTGVYPLSIHAGEEVVFHDNPTEADYMSLYPTIKMARVQAKMMQVFGALCPPMLGYNYTNPSTFNLGVKPLTKEEELKRYPWQAAAYFSTRIDTKFVNKDKVDSELMSFIGALEEIEKTIEERNKNRKYQYVEMLPSRIPCSINI